ncbi:MAG: aminopeptidase N [Alphaproteobacteria bacterium]
MGEPAVSATVEQPTPKYLSDYRPPDYLIDTVFLDFQLGEANTEVEARLSIRRNPDAGGTAAPLILDGEGLTLLAICMNGQRLPEPRYTADAESLTIHEVPERFTLEIITRIQPEKNTALEGLYVSNHIFCTQCEAEGFRNITYFLDRPDVMARYRTRIEADKAAYPVLLANGNKVASGERAGGRHYAIWEDPFPKPSYLFALVAGDLAVLEDRFVTKSGRDVSLQIYAEPEQIDKCGHAMTALKDSMRWDEERFGLEYDLDQFMIAAISDFNMGAMENKGLNVFNTKYVLAKPETATDADYHGIERVIAHEYFHNWTGNRITCRDWFQLSLKEGLTVFRDQEFTADMHSRAVKRIEDARGLRAHQFIEDSGPLAHAVRPESYVEINNFYTTTIYEKGAEVVRMIHTLIGEEAFQKGMQIYVERHDGQAVTCEDFVACMEAASGRDLATFRRWYSQAGTPRLSVEDDFDEEAGRYRLTVRQKTPPTPMQPEKAPQHIPLALGLLDRDGRDAPVTLAGETEPGPATRVLELTDAETTFTFDGLSEKPVPSLLRGFSAPVILEGEPAAEQLRFLMAHDGDSFVRWDAGQRYATSLILASRATRGVDRELDHGLREAFEAVLDDESFDHAFQALALTLPAESYVAQQMEVIDVDGIHAARRALRTGLGQTLAGRWLDLYHRLGSNEPYRFDGPSMGRRSLRNLALGYLMAADHEEGRALCLAQFEQGDNMTDVLAALALLADSDHPARGEALARFYERWQNEALVIDKWFTLQAMPQRPDALDQVQQLKTHPAFKMTNPNRVRSLIGAFAMANATGFHRKDGAGYRFLADQIMELDRLNPQIAARLMGIFGRWRRYDGERQALMKQEIERVLSMPNLSRNSHEVAKKSLG